MIVPEINKEGKRGKIILKKIYGLME